MSNIAIKNETGKSETSQAIHISRKRWRLYTDPIKSCEMCMFAASCSIEPVKSCLLLLKRDKSASEQNC